MEQESAMAAAEGVYLLTKWAGRITGALMIGFVVFMIIGHRGLLTPSGRKTAMPHLSPLPDCLAARWV
jgi:hypothetical protein